MLSPKRGKEKIYNGFVVIMTNKSQKFKKSMRSLNGESKGLFFFRDFENQKPVTLVFKFLSSLSYPDTTKRKLFCRSR